MKFVCEPEANYSTGLRESMVFQGDAEVLLKQFPFTRHITTIAFSEYIFTHGSDGSTGNNAGTDRRLNCNLEHLSGDDLRQLIDNPSSPGISFVLMYNYRKGIYQFTV